MKRHLAYAALVLGLVPVLLVTAGCSSGGGLYVSSTALEFGALSTSLPLDLGRAGDTALTWTVTSNQDWLLVSRRTSTSAVTDRQAPGQTLQGTGPVQLLVTVVRDGLTAGTHTGTLTLNTSSGDSTVPVTVSVAAGTTPVVSVSPSALNLGSTLTVGTFSVNNTGVGALTWTAAATDAPWITSISPDSGTNGANCTVTVDRSSLTPGTHTGAVTVSTNAGDATVTVTVTVPSAVLSVLPTALDFGSEATTMSLSIRNTGGGALAWTATPSQPWVSVNAASGTGDTMLAVTVNRTSLAVGANHAQIAIAGAGGTVNVPITVTRPGSLGPVAYVAPSLLDFGTTETQKTLTIRNLGAGTLIWSVAIPAADQPWLSIVGAAAGSGDGAVTVAINRAAITGSATGTVLLTSNGGNSSATVTAEATAVPAVTESTLSFGKYDTTDHVQLTNVGQGVMDWTAVSSQPWLTVSPSSGTANSQMLTIEVDRTGVAEGTQVGAITISVPNAGSVTIDVTMQVNTAPVIASLTADRTQVPPGGAVVCTANVTDADDTALVYTWSTSAAGATITGVGQAVSWSAPATPGTYTVTCVVRDTDGASDTASLTITVYPTGSITVPVD